MQSRSVGPSSAGEYGVFDRLLSSSDVFGEQRGVLTPSTPPTPTPFPHPLSSEHL